MRLFDVATVIENGSHWPSEGDSRDCGLFIAGGEVCSPPVEGTGGTVTLNVVAGLLGGSIRAPREVHAGRRPRVAGSAVEGGH